MGVNRPDVSLGRCLMWSLSRTRRSRAARSGGFFGPPTLHRGPDEPQYFADHRRRNPLNLKGFRCNYTFGTGTPQCSKHSIEKAASKHSKIRGTMAELTCLQARSKVRALLMKLPMRFRERSAFCSW